ncbi:5-formyltetrahydrofolate cyclo-ligase [endosymbiont of Acanthamoeba sp. UWC8]|uniref:5-formyltetrahydrofolate cyclo-ligase n=1 Tax=endosymbiont of Acanthamoeba sp. UWC8 TaxID=86106 RepID=UPI0004D1E24C|nr:5-formyltetrahydrofolate cyclo-ligase [endosymbiont of Acanthamoeba sp. UWC8]AIF80875.1 5-formyltetrahydrofolate cyclo-ligase [endosymbiont of Acanthamoeba sp. UWC8]
MKNKLRIELKQLKKIKLEYIEYDFIRFKNNLFSLIEGFNIKTIAGFHPKSDEVNILPILIKAMSTGYKVALPRIIQKNSYLKFIKWMNDDPLERNDYGIFEPKAAGEELTPDIIITPLLGFDRSMNRIGYGGGYYDRTFIEYPNAIRVGIGYSFQEVKNIPLEDHDQKLDYIVTEKEIIKK